MAMSMAEDAEAAAVLQPTVANPRITWHSRTVRSPIAEWVSAAVFTKLTLRVAALALFAPIFCFWLDLHGKAIDPSLVSLLVATPAAFLISAAFQRRERAMADLSDSRTHAVSLHRAFGQYGRPEQAAAGQRAVQGCFANFAVHLKSFDQQSLEEAYRHLKDLSAATERLRLEPSDHVREHVDTLVGRLLFDERSFLRVMEQLRLVRSFRTPAILRGLLAASVLVLPILQGPGFANELEHAGSSAAPIALSLLFAVANATLVNIQNALEDPFDGDTADDISLALFEPNWAFWTEEPTARPSPQGHA